MNILKKRILNRWRRALSNLPLKKSRKSPLFTNTKFFLFTIKTVYRPNQQYKFFLSIISKVKQRDKSSKWYFLFFNIYWSFRRIRSKNSIFMISLLTKDKLLGEEGYVGFKGIPRWFKTSGYFYHKKICIYHIVFCNKSLRFRILLHLFMQFFLWLVTFRVTISQCNLKNSTLILHFKFQ